MIELTGILERLGARRLSLVSTAPAPPPLLNRLDPEGHTVLFGTGGVGKGSLAAWWIVQLVAAGYRVLLVDYENHPGEWARRIFNLGGAAALEGVLYVAPLSAEWHGKRGPLWVGAAELRELADEDGSTYIVIDSAVPACGATDPLKPEAASQYTAALELIGRPALSLAHVTKADDLRYPFGSVFWHNLARMTWSMAREGDGALLMNRKANNYGRLGRYIVALTWFDGRLGEVSERPYMVVLADRIADALADGPLTVAGIVDRLNEDGEGEPIKADSIRHALRRGARDKPPRFEEQSGDRWAVAS
jgi:hypothetical protein